MARPAGLSRSRSLLVPAASARYWCPWPTGLPSSKSLLVPAPPIVQRPQASSLKPPASSLQPQTSSLQPPASGLGVSLWRPSARGPHDNHILGYSCPSRSTKGVRHFSRLMGSGISRSRSLLVPAASARYWRPRPAGLLRSKSLRVPAARGALEVEFLTGARGLCSLLVPVARGAPEVEIVTGARGPRGYRGRGRYWCPDLKTLKKFLSRRTKQTCARPATMV